MGSKHSNLFFTLYIVCHYRNRYYYWNIETDDVCWLSPLHPRADVTLSAEKSKYEGNIPQHSMAALLFDILNSFEVPIHNLMNSLHASMFQYLYAYHITTKCHGHVSWHSQAMLLSSDFVRNRHAFGEPEGTWQSTDYFHLSCVVLGKPFQGGFNCWGTVMHNIILTCFNLW